MPNRNVEGNYRYKYQGQEVDPETGKEAFELRLWDARIGRWLTTDPAGQYNSPYMAMGNNPLRMIDPDGGTANDIITLDTKGNVTNIDTKHDGPDIIVNEKGKTIFDGFERDGQFLESYKEVSTTLLNKPATLSFLELKDFDLAKELFVALADNTTVEFGIDVIKNSKDNFTSFVHTLHNEKRNSNIIKDRILFGLPNDFRVSRLRLSAHSHNGGAPTSSDQDERNGKVVFSKGARFLSKFIYHSGRGKYNFRQIYRYFYNGRIAPPNSFNRLQSNDTNKILERLKFVR